ncbi:MAG: PEP-CTERM sorting domain-containing protein [Gemmatimonadaceae bacterium]
MNKVAKRLFLAALFAAPFSGVSAQQHAYNLQNGSLADLIGSTSLVADGAHTTTIGQGISFAASNGFSLGSVFTSGGSYTLVMQFMLNGATPSSGYQKVVDFKDQTLDAGYYALGGKANFYPINTGANAVYNTNVFQTTVLTRNVTPGNGSVFSAYVNGALQFQFDDNGGLADFSGTNNIARFFEDDAATNKAEVGSGILGCLSTYNTAKASTEIASLATCSVPVIPPVTTTPEPSSLALSLAGLTAVFFAARKRKGTITR